LDTPGKIKGVVIKKLRLLRDDRGWLTEILRADDPLFEKFGQVYVTVAAAGVVKAWHCHERQTDHLAVVAGTARLVLYDARPDSPTHGNVIEVVTGEESPALVIVPPGVYHGFKPLGDGPAYVVNVPTEIYDYDTPDEIRRPYDDPDIPYDWGEAHPASG
jgi:dTDP-4-dehydrorhamnose 3,5-epimerase